jgi:hypothetical protein
MEVDEQTVDTIVLPRVPPPPPPRDDDDDYEETAVKEEEGPDSVTEFKSPMDADMNTPTSELKRKLEDSDLLDADVKAKKIKDSDDIPLPKTNGIHNSEDVSMDEVGSNGAYLKNEAADVDGPLVKEQATNGVGDDSR